jgi:hypothetical protein
MCTLTENEIGTILMGSSERPQDVKYPWGSTSLVDNKLNWADIKITHDCTELTRQEKIKYILKKYIKSKEIYPFLRVCNSITQTSLNDLNCNRCEKCLRTITGLILEDIDPNKCGFKIDNGTFEYVKNCFINGTLELVENAGTSLHNQTAISTTNWKNIQREIPNEIIHNLHSSKEFFEWFRTFDLTEYEHNIKKKIVLSKLFEILNIRLFSCVAPLWYSIPNRVQ